MKKIGDLPFNTVIQCFGQRMLIVSRSGVYVYCVGYNRRFRCTFRLKETTLVKVLA